MFRKLLKTVFLSVLVISAAYVAFFAIEKSVAMKFRKLAESEVAAQKAACLDLQKSSNREKEDYLKSNMALQKELALRNKIIEERDLRFQALEKEYKLELAALDERYKSQLKAASAQPATPEVAPSPPVGTTTKQAASVPVRKKVLSNYTAIKTAPVASAFSSLSAGEKVCVNEELSLLETRCVVMQYPAPRTKVEIVDTRSWIANPANKSRAFTGIKDIKKNVFVCVNKTDRKPDYFFPDSPESIAAKCQAKLSRQSVSQ